MRWEGLVGASKYWALYAVQILPLLPTSGATSSLFAEAESLWETLGNLSLLCLQASVYSGVGAEPEGNLGCCSSGAVYSCVLSQFLTGTRGSLRPASPGDMLGPNLPCPPPYGFYVSAGDQTWDLRLVEQVLY